MSDTYLLLSKINTPDDLRQMSQADLPRLAEEIRHFFIEHINQTGGHFASSLGAIELTIALHTVFNTPHDQIVWDVGHQAYAHKLLTGRRLAMTAWRQQGGLSGFLKRSESVYDTFGAGHSSTALSAALGMALAAQRLGVQRHHVAVVGDGALTAGLAFEALNHLGNSQAKVLLIVNDNADSIAKYSAYHAGYLTPLLNPLHAAAFFKSFNLNYTGPVDGHDIDRLTKELKILREQTGPCVLHITTQKGKGFVPAEQAPIKYHAVNPGFLAARENTTQTTLSYSQVFGNWLCQTAKQDTRLIAITPNMREGSGMVKFAEQYPQQYIDVGIAEQHAVTLAAGLACAGMKPIVAIYSTFLQRAYDQVIHDVALQNLPVVFAIDRAGIVGADGATHMGQFDLSFLRCIPNLVVMTPADENECWQLLNTAYHHAGPVAVRYPRGLGPGVAVLENAHTLAIGKAEIRRQGQSGCAILAFGSTVAPALQAAAEIDATVVNMRFVKPLDEQLLDSLLEKIEQFVTIEENAIKGGAGSAVNEYLQKQKFKGKVLNLGLPDQFIEQGKAQDLLRDCGLDAAGIIKAIRQNF